MFTFVRLALWDPLGNVSHCESSRQPQMQEYNEIKMTLSSKLKYRAILLHIKVIRYKIQRSFRHANVLQLQPFYLGISETSYFYEPCFHTLGIIHMKNRQIGVLMHKYLSASFVGLQHGRKNVVCKEFKGGFLPIFVCMKTEYTLSGSETCIQEEADAQNLMKVAAIKVMQLSQWGRYA